MLVLVYRVAKAKAKLIVLTHLNMKKKWRKTNGMKCYSKLSPILIQHLHNTKILILLWIALVLVPVEVDVELFVTYKTFDTT